MAIDGVQTSWPCSLCAGAGVCSAGACPFVARPHALIAAPVHPHIPCMAPAAPQPPARPEQQTAAAQPPPPPHRRAALLDSPALQVVLVLLMVALAAVPSIVISSARSVWAATTPLPSPARASSSLARAAASPAPSPAPRPQPPRPSPSPSPKATPGPSSSGSTQARAFSGSTPGMSSQAFKYREPVVFNAREKHTGTVIMLHGLGDSGDGWASVGVEWAPALKHVKFVFPHAPSRPISVNFGMRMPGWYDIASLEDIDQHEDKAGLLESQRYVEELVAAEAALGVPSERVVVAGFSQGGAVAFMALRSHMKLAGVVALSTYLPLRKEPPLVSAANQNTPIFQAHGDADYTVGYKFGVSSYNLLKEAGADISFKTYNGMAHGAVPQEIADVGAFLAKVLPPIKG